VPGEPIENLHAYVVSAATRTCYAFLRERHPERTRLRNRVRYAVSHHSDTGLTVDASGTSQCVARKAVRAVPAAGATISFLDAPATFLSKHRISTADSLPAVIAAVLERLDSPIDLDRLVDGLAVAFGIVELEAPPPREPDPE
jgi:2-methylcitrate dehydratase PrpD